MAPIPNNRAVKRLTPLLIIADGNSVITLYALCYDGSAWQTWRPITSPTWNAWEQIPAIPQAGGVQ